MATTALPNPIPDIFPHMVDVVDYLPGRRALYCRPCRHAIFPSGLYTHLHKFHGVKPAIRRDALAFYSALDVARSTTELTPLPDHGLPLTLLPIVRGYACQCCRFLRKSRKDVMSHLNTAHQLRRHQAANKASSVCLQSWFLDTRASYWIVPDPTMGEGGQDPNSASATAGAKEEAILEALERQEEQRLEGLHSDPISWDVEVEASETTTWLLRTRWPQQFAHCSLDVIAQSTLQPVHHQRGDYELGYSQSGHALISTTAQEFRLRQLLQLVDLVFQRCEQTLAATSLTLRCWLRSYSSRSHYPRPFGLPQETATKHRYYQYWKRFLCFVFRASTISPQLREQVYGRIDFTEQQTELIEQIKAQIDALESSKLEPELEPELDPELEPKPNPNPDPDPTSLPDGPERRALVEQLFQLCCSFLTQPSAPDTGETTTLPLGYFTAALGVHRYTLAFNTAYAYTPILAALMWVSRLLLLEFALPLQAYQVEGWPARLAYPNPLQRLQQVQSAYTYRGGLHVFGMLTELLRYGRKVALKEGSRANVSWSPSGAVLLLYDQRIPMARFQELVWSTIRDCHDKVHKALLGWQPPQTDLGSMRDTLSNRQPEWSFLREPRNRLQGSFKHLHRHAWLSTPLQAHQQWSGSRCRKYLHSLQRVRKLLLLCVHMTGGMPGRGPEITTIRWCNTRLVVRNLLLYHGRLAVAVEYNKTRTITNNSFYVVRMLPACVSQLLFTYLAYIRPFADALAHQMHGQTAVPRSTEQARTDHGRAYVFADAGQHYNTTQFSKALSQQAQQVGLNLTIATYRQAVAAIVKQHLLALHQPFDAEQPFLEFARQFGHQAKELATAYAIHRDFPTRLQPELLNQYEKVSHQWHQYLHLGELERELVVAEAQARVEAQEASVRTAEVAEDEAEVGGGGGLSRGKRRLLETETGVAGSREGGNKRKKTETLPAQVREALSVLTDFLNRST